MGAGAARASRATGPSPLGGARQGPRRRAPLSAPCRWSRLGNEGEAPGGLLCSPACDLPQGARLSQHLGRRSPELRWISLGFRGQSSAVREPPRVRRVISGKPEGVGRFGRLGAGAELLAPLPHCQIATADGKRRAEPGGADTSGPRRPGRQRPATPRTACSPSGAQIWPTTPPKLPPTAKRRGAPSDVRPVSFAEHS
jgi:hypothetical protein